MFFLHCFAVEQINMHLGRVRILDLGKAPLSIQIENPDIIDIERVGVSNSVKVTPKHNGLSDVHILYPEGEDVLWKIKVGDGVETENSIDKNADLSPHSEEEYHPSFDTLLLALEKIAGLHVDHQEGRLVISGHLKTYEAFRHLASIVAPYPSLFFPAYDINKNISKKIINHINDSLKIFGENNLFLSCRQNLYILSGVPSSPAARLKIWKYVSALIPRLIDAMSYHVGESAMVQINLEFLEISKKNSNEVGFHNTIETGMENNLQPVLQIAPISVLFKAVEDKNFIKEIAKPIVLTRSGEKASFLAGGEVPIVASNTTSYSSSSSVTYKPFGILFHATPVVQADGSIWLKLNFEVSQVSEDLSYQNIPGFTSRKIDTNIVLKNGNTAILSGLVQNKDLKQMSKVPFLNQIPILGELFKSRRFQDQDTELWVAVTAISDTSNYQESDQNWKNFNEFIIQKEKSFQEKMIDVEIK